MFITAYRSDIDIMKKRFGTYAIPTDKITPDEWKAYKPLIHGSGTSDPQTRLLIAQTQLTRKVVLIGLLAAAIISELLAYLIKEPRPTYALYWAGITSIFLLVFVLDARRLWQDQGVSEETLNT